MASTMRGMSGLMVMTFAIALTGCNDDARGGGGAGTSASSALNVGTGVISSPQRPVATPPPVTPAPSPAPTPTPTPTPAPELAISGTPPAAVTVGSAYAFTPSVSAPAGAQVSFAISHAPSWAHFNAGTGQLTGSPAAGDVGTDAAIQIVASSGTTTASLAPFSISVAAAPTQTVTVSWTPPIVNADGTPVSGLSGYHLHYGPSADQMTSEITVAGATDTSQNVVNLTTGTWYFAISSYNTMNIESKLSTVLSVTI